MLHLSNASKRQSNHLLTYSLTIRIVSIEIERSVGRENKFFLSFFFNFENKISSSEDEIDFESIVFIEGQRK